MNKNEKLHSQEYLSESNVEVEKEDSVLSYKKAEKIFILRYEALSTINGYVSPYTYETIRGKLESEKKELLEIIDYEKKRENFNNSKTTQLLDEAYFIQKPLDKNSF